MMPSRRAMLGALVAVLLVAGVGLTVGVLASRGHEGTPPALRFSGTPLEPPAPAPDFVLHDARGRLVRLSARRGGVTVVTFLYTHCPDVCPLIAANLNLALRKLGPAGSDVKVVAVSVDPRGDTRESVLAYRRKLRLLPNFDYLVGSQTQLEPIWRAYHIAASAQRAGVLVDHSATSFLIDGDGRQRAVYDSRVKARDVVHDVGLLLDEPAS